VPRSDAAVVENEDWTKALPDALLACSRDGVDIYDSRRGQADDTRSDPMTQPSSTGGPDPEPVSQPRRGLTHRMVVAGSIIAASTLACWVAFGTATTFILVTLAITVTFGASLSTLTGFVASAVLAVTLVGGSLVLSDRGTTGAPSFLLPIVVIGVLILYLLAWVGGSVIGSTWRWTRRRGSTA
jgi:hypothetical protein